MAPDKAAVASAPVLGLVQGLAGQQVAVAVRNLENGLQGAPFH